MHNTPPIPRPALFGAIVVTALLGIVAVAHGAGWIIGNATTSVRPGLYHQSGQETATHVTFCLGERHRGAPWYRRLCSPDLPDGPRILKRVVLVQGNSVTVEGDGPRALDSRFLGPVRTEEIRGWWRPVVRIGGQR